MLRARPCGCLRPRHSRCRHEVARQVAGVAAMLAFLAVFLWLWIAGHLP